MGFNAAPEQTYQDARGCYYSATTTTPSFEGRGCHF
jgi:hypothetical protein